MPSLAHLLRASAQGAPFDVRAACAIAAQLCIHLEQPHGAVAPSTILVDWDGSVSLDRAGQAPGPMLPSTLPYMAPERLAGAAPDARSDVHAVAMVLLELVTGRPVRRESGLTFSGNVPVELIELLERSSSRDPAIRHSSPRELAAWLALAEEESGGAMSREELAGWLAERFGQTGAPARAVSRGHAPMASGRRWRLGAIAGLLALAGAGAAVLARPILTGAEAEPAAAPTAMADMPASAMPTEASAAARKPDAVTSAAMSAGSMTAAGMAPTATRPAMAASEPAAMAASEPAAEPAHKPRRKRPRAAHKPVAEAEPAAAPADAKRTPAAAPLPSCPMSQAAPDAMAPAPSDAMSPAARPASPRRDDAMSPTAAPASRKATPGGDDAAK